MTTQRESNTKHHASLKRKELPLNADKMTNINMQYCIYTSMQKQGSTR